MSATDAEEQSRRDLVNVMRRMASSGLNRGTSGNASVRLNTGMLVTPSGIHPDELTPDAIVHVDAEGVSRPGSLNPSSEYRMHLRILQRRQDAQAVVHCHSRYAAILACCHTPIEPIHYMVSVTGFGKVPVAPYALFGSEELADGVVVTLEGRHGCLLANHGQIALGRTLGQAFAIAEELEEQAAVYYGALLLGTPQKLSETQIADVVEQFRSYGQARITRASRA